MSEPVDVYPAPEVKWCFECGGPPEWDDYKDNDCFLCGADHSPLNAEANYFCRAHLDRDAVIYCGHHNMRRHNDDGTIDCCECGEQIN